MKGWTKEMVRVTVEMNYPFCNGVTKDEALQLAHDLLCELQQTRKETAEKYHELIEKAIESVPNATKEFIQAWKDKNDEICKEITEGKK